MRIIILSIVAITVLALLIYWQANKHEIVENTIQKTVHNKSASLYSIKYDSSYVDELNGNVSFYNVHLLSDTNTVAAETAKNVFSARIGEVAIKGVNVIQFLRGHSFQARSIQFIDPIFELRKRDVLTYTKEDTLALYEQMLGKYKSIQAEEILITKGSVKILDELDNSTTHVAGIDIDLTDFKIDSTKDYESLVSYFIKGLHAKVDSVGKTKASKQIFSISGIEYNARTQTLNVDNAKSYRNGKVISTFADLSLDGMETSTFLREQRIVANTLKSAGGNITLYIEKGKNENTLGVDSTVFDNARIKRLILGKTKVVLIDRAEINNPPVVLSNVELTATDIPAVDGSLTKLIAKSNWNIKGDGLTRRSKSGLYDLIIGPYSVNKAARTASIRSFQLKPVMSEIEFVRTRKTREDYVQLQANEIFFTNVDLEGVFAKRILRADEVSLQPVIRIFKDKTLPKNTGSRVSTDPAQVLRNFNFGLSINRMNVRKGHLTYREKGTLSGKTGGIFFDNLNGVLTNVTNITSEYTARPQMKVQADAKFMNEGRLDTRWTIQLNQKDDPFKVSGSLTGMEGGKLNGALEPLSMISVKKGRINKFVFDTEGNRLSVNTKATLLYDDLKLTLLEKENASGGLGKKTVLSFLANIFIADRNPDDGRVRHNQVVYPRDSSRSFINVISQSLFLAIRKSITGKGRPK